MQTIYELTLHKRSTHLPSLHENCLAMISSIGYVYLLKNVQKKNKNQTLSTVLISICMELSWFVSSHLTLEITDSKIEINSGGQMEYVHLYITVISYDQTK